MEIKERTHIIQVLRYFNLPLVAVEVGVASGSFSEELLQSGMEKVYSVDAWEYMPMSGDISYPQAWHDENYKNAKERLHKYGDRSTIIKGFSHKVAEQFQDNFFGLVYLDGCHDLTCIQKDIEMWYPKLVDGGIMSTHDFGNDGYGVKSAVTYFCTNNNLEIHMIVESDVNNCSVWFQKPIKTK